MKKLMIAASVVAIGAAAFADVYSVKFTATTSIDAVRKVRGEDVNYWKKSNVAINGFWDKDNKKYYFWTGTGKNMVPVQNVTFEFTNDTDLDSSVNGKNYSANVGFYVGDEKGEIVSYFISGGFGAVKTVATDDLNSMNGSFGGTWNGFPAFGTWSLSRNAAATKDLEATIAKQGKQAGITIASWTDGLKPAPIIETYKAQASEIAEQLAEIKALVEVTNKVDDLEKQVADLNGQIVSNEALIATLEADAGANAELIEELRKENKALAEVAANLTSLLAQLNNKDELSGELLNDFLASVTNSQTTAYVEATNMVETLKAAKKAYDDLEVIAVYTNEYGVVTNADLSAAAIAKLEEAVATTSNAVDVVDAAWDAKWDEYEEANNLLDYYQALQAAGDNYENFVNDRSNLINNVIADIAWATNEEAKTIAEYTNAVALAGLDYTNTILAIQGEFDNVTNNLVILTNDLTVVDLAETNALYDAALDDYAAATNSLAVIPDYNTWYEIYGDPTATENANKIAYGEFRAAQEEDLEAATEALEARQADVDGVKARIAKFAAVLDQVVAAGKDDPSKWVGKAKELAEAAAATNALEIAEAAAARDEELANWADYKAEREAEIARLQKQIDEGKSVKISVADVEAQSALVQDILTNDLPKAEAAYDKAWDDYTKAQYSLDYCWWPVMIAAEELKWLVGEYPYVDAFAKKYEELLKKWEDLAAEAKRNLDAAQALLDA